MIPFCHRLSQEQRDKEKSSQVSQPRTNYSKLETQAVHEDGDGRYYIPKWPDQTFTQSTNGPQNQGHSSTVNSYGGFNSYSVTDGEHSGLSGGSNACLQQSQGMAEWQRSVSVNKFSNEISNPSCSENASVNRSNTTMTISGEKITSDNMTCCVF